MPKLPLLELPFLSLLMFLPLAGALIILVLKREWINAIRGVATAVSFLQVVIVMYLWAMYDPALTGVNSEQAFQFVEHNKWVELAGLGVFGRISIDYFVGVDGLSFAMVLLTALISFISTVASYAISKSVKGYYIMLLLLVTGMMGVFCSLDFFLFFIFWEAMLLPMYFLIGIWGGQRREYASLKFLLYTLLGSVFMLLVMLGLYFSTSILIKDAVTGGPLAYNTFSMVAMMDVAKQVPGSLFAGSGTEWRYAAFFALLFCFAIKLPVVPFHTWLPDAHVEAPTPVSVMLAGVLLKTGAYGIIRVAYGVFPDIAAATAEYIAIFGVINILYGALCAMAQKDLKRLVAYSSISHMGFVLLGISAMNSQGLMGAVMQMFSHGLIIAMLFLLVGALEARTGTRGVNDFGGLSTAMPRLFAFSLIACFAALGLPALSGFVAEAFVLLGAFQTWQLWTMLAAIGIVITSGYFLWTLQRLFFGEAREQFADILDLSRRELATLVPLAALIVFMGVYPSPVMKLMTSSVNRLASVVQHAATAAATATTTP